MSKANTASKAIMLPVSMKSKAFFIRNCEVKPGRYFVRHRNTQKIGIFFQGWYQLIVWKGETPVDGIIELNQSFEKSFINMSVQDRQKLSMAFPKIGRILYKRC